MRIVILGAGQVGSSVAENLVSEANDITVVDVNSERLKKLQDRLDLRTITGRVRFDEGGDIAGPRFMILRSDPHASGRDVGVYGMVLDRVITPAGGTRARTGGG